VTNPTSRQKS
jgi:pyruvate formate-lyase activating enzyme-like uncharacterized protein